MGPEEKGFGSACSGGRWDNLEQMASLWGILNKAQILELQWRCNHWPRRALPWSQASKVIASGVAPGSPAVSRHDSCGSTSAMSAVLLRGQRRGGKAACKPRHQHPLLTGTGCREHLFVP